MLREGNKLTHKFLPSPSLPVCLPPTTETHLEPSQGGKLLFSGRAVLAKKYFQHLGYQMPANENPAGMFE